MKMKKKYAEGIENEKLLKWGGNAHVYCLWILLAYVLFVVNVGLDRIIFISFNLYAIIKF